MNREQIEKAINKAFQLGQLYWQQADSEYISHNKKAEVTRDTFEVMKEEALRSLESAEPTNREKIYGPLLEKLAAKTNQCGETCERAKEGKPC